MTKKADLQKELLEKVKLGTKPSDIKRLKRSKSEGDLTTIPAAPPPPNHLLTDQLKEKQQEIEVLRKKTEDSAKQIEELRKASETKSTTIRLLRESLERDDKEREITELKKELAQVKQLLDNSLEARTKSLSEWTKRREQIKSLNQELNETIDQANSELTAGDTEISQLRTKIWTLKSAKESLERELKLARINRRSPPLKDSPIYDNNFLTNLNYFQYALYALMAVWFALLLTNTKYKPND